MPGENLVDTLEMYLKAVLELEEEGVAPMRVRLAERFDHLTSTVSGTVRRLQRNGLMQLDPKRRLVLTEQGREIAEAVMHKHRLAEVFLDRMVGLDWELIHNEACRWEHVISDRVAVLLDELLGYPQRTPYGNVIRDVRSHGTQSAVSEEVTVDSLARLVSNPGGTQARIEWIGERLQANPEALLTVRQRGLMPGAILHASMPDRNDQADQTLVVQVIIPGEPVGAVTEEAMGNTSAQAWSGCTGQVGSADQVRHTGGSDKKDEANEKEVSSAGGTEIPLTLAAHLFARNYSVEA